MSLCRCNGFVVVTDVSYSVMISCDNVMTCRPGSPPTFVEYILILHVTLRVLGSCATSVLVRHHYVGHHYIGHNDTGHKYMGHDHKGHYCIGPHYICHDSIAPAITM